METEPINLNYFEVEGRAVHILDDIQLTEAQQQKAIEIVKESLVNFKTIRMLNPNIALLKKAVRLWWIFLQGLESNSNPYN